MEVLVRVLSSWHLSICLIGIVLICVLDLFGQLRMLAIWSSASAYIYSYNRILWLRLIANRAIISNESEILILPGKISTLIRKSCSNSPLYIVSNFMTWLSKEWWEELRRMSIPLCPITRHSTFIHDFNLVKLYWLR